MSIMHFQIDGFLDSLGKWGRRTNILPHVLDSISLSDQSLGATVLINIAHVLQTRLLLGHSLKCIEPIENISNSHIGDLVGNSNTQPQWGVGEVRGMSGGHLSWDQA
ncbi:hypothetical protein ACJX0J_008402, partial [Zea mays]